MANGMLRVPSLAASSQLYLDHSHCLVLAPATLAALPSTRATPDRGVFYVAQPTRSIPAFVPNFRPQQKATKKTKIPNRDNSDLRSLRYLLFIRCSEL